jgi:hypothetical protein
MAGSCPTGVSGSWAKAQPPSAGHSGVCSFRAGLVAGGLTKQTRVVLLVIGIPAQEFDGESGTFELLQSFDRFRGSPILSGHGGSSRLDP